MFFCKVSFPTVSYQHGELTFVRIILPYRVKLCIEKMHGYDAIVLTHCTLLGFYSLHFGLKGLHVVLGYQFEQHNIKYILQKIYHYKLWIF
jgi:hypothetical protein